MFYSSQDKRHFPFPQKFKTPVRLLKIQIVFPEETVLTTRGARNHLLVNQIDLRIKF